MHKCKCKFNYFSLCALNLFKSLVLLIVMILDHIKKENTNSQSQQIRILHTTNNKKKLLVNCWPSGKYVHLLYMYSILRRAYFCFNYCLISAWHGGDQFVALLKWYGRQGFSDSGLQLFCIVGSGVSHLDSRWASGLVSLLVNQAQ